MKKQRGVCVEINGVFYESLRMAGRTIKYNRDTIKKRCLSDNYCNYKFVPFKITYTKKECIKCKKIKLLSEFYNKSSSRDKHGYMCKKCDSEFSKKYKQNNEKHVKEYREAHKEEVKITRQKNRKIENAQERMRRKNDLSFKINKNVSRAINHSLKGKKNGAPWESLVGYTCLEFIAHMKSLFTEGMSWNNYGKSKYEWSFDHIIAIYWWNITSNTCQGFKDCWALDNLQPLWHTRNVEKGTKPMEPKYLIKPF